MPEWQVKLQPLSQMVALYPHCNVLLVLASQSAENSTRYKEVLPNWQYPPFRDSIFSCSRYQSELFKAYIGCNTPKFMENTKVKKMIALRNEKGMI